MELSSQKDLDFFEKRKLISYSGILSISVRMIFSKYLIFPNTCLPKNLFVLIIAVDKMLSVIYLADAKHLKSEIRGWQSLQTLGNPKG